MGYWNRQRCRARHFSVGDRRRFSSHDQDAERHPRSRTSTSRPARLRMIDVGKVTFLDHMTKPPKRYFLNVSSFGLAASIIDASKVRLVPGWLPIDTVRGRASFALSTLQEVIASTRRRASPYGRRRRTAHSANGKLLRRKRTLLRRRDDDRSRSEISDGFLDVINIGDIAPRRSFSTPTRSIAARTSTCTKSRTRSRNISKPVRLTIRRRPYRDRRRAARPLPAAYEIVPNAHDPGPIRVS